jgi:hypothetical protein
MIRPKWFGLCAGCLTLIDTEAGDVCGQVTLGSATVNVHDTESCRRAARPYPSNKEKLHTELLAKRLGV